MNKKKIAIGASVGAVVLLGGAYVVAYFVAGNHVPAKAQVDGVAIGGMSPSEAEAKLREELASTAETPIKLSAGDISVDLEPAKSGLGIDYQATVAAAGGGFSWNPINIIATLTGGADVELVRTVDKKALTSAVEGARDDFAKEAKDATLTFKDGKIERTNGADAEALNIDDTVAATSKAYTAGEHKAEAVLDHTAPKVTTAMVDEAVTSYAEPLLSGPITLTANGKSIELKSAELAEITSFSAKDGKLMPTIDKDKLYDNTKEARSELGLEEAKDASFKLVGNGVEVVPAEEGRTVSKDALAEAVNKTAFGSGDARKTDVKVETQKPEFTTEKAKELGDFEVIGEFTTEWNHSTYRNKNLTTAAGKVNGTVLMPDDIFSLNGTLGPRTAENGYTQGYAINGGRMVLEYGGGISQSATTLYNAAFFAGYKDIEHKPHSFYFSRYPAGREATVYYGSLDMRFQNDTKYPSIIQGYVKPSSQGTKGSITFKIWSKRTYDKVESTEPVKSDYYVGQDRVVTAPDCEPQSPIQGFTATWQRLFYKDGAVVKRENYSWKYNASGRITCG